MVFRPDAKQPNLDRLLAVLQTTGLQTKDNPTFQVLDGLIKSLKRIQEIVNKDIINITTGVPAGADTQIQFNRFGLLSGSPNLVFDHINVKVGIGTPTPGAGLDVRSGGIWANGFSDAAALTPGSAIIFKTSLGGSAISGGFTITDDASSNPVYASMYLDSNGHFNIDNLKIGVGRNNILIAPNGGNVGFGTATATHKVDIVGGSLASGIRALNVTGSLNTTAATQIGIVFAITSAAAAGANARQFGLLNNLIAGYTGAASTYAIAGQNTVASTGINPFGISSGGNNFSGGNVGVFGTSQATTVGVNIGVYGRSLGAAYNYGAWNLGAGITGTTPLNIGTISYGVGLSTTGVIAVGLYAGLQNGDGSAASTNSNSGGINPITISTVIYADNGDTAKRIFAGRNNGSDVIVIDPLGKLGIIQTTPTAWLHLTGVTTAAATAPLKFDSGTIMTTPEVGAFEFSTDNIYFTITTGAARKGIILNDGADLTSGKIPIAATNGRLIDGQTPLNGTKVYFVSDTSGGAITRKLTFINGILTSET